MRPRGTPIRAVADGFIRKVFMSRQGGLTIYEFDRESVYCFYYAHLDHYAEKLREGMPVERGDVIGYVGTTGDTAPDAPQLHFAIFKLGLDKNWWKGEAIDPYPILMRAVTEPQSIWVKMERSAISVTGTGFACAKLSGGQKPFLPSRCSGRQDDTTRSCFGLGQNEIMTAGGRMASVFFPVLSASPDFRRADARASRGWSRENPAARPSGTRR